MKSRFSKFKIQYSKLLAAAVLAVLAIGIMPQQAQAGSVSCTTVEYRTGNNVDCNFQTSVSGQPNKRYGVFVFIDVAQTYIDNIGSVDVLNRDGRFVLRLSGVVGPNAYAVDRLTADQLNAAGGTLRKAIPAIDFRTPSQASRNNVLVILTELATIFGSEIPSAPLDRGSAYVNFQIPSGEQLAISVQPSTTGPLSRIFRATYTKDGQVVTTGANGNVLQVRWTILQGTATLDTSSVAITGENRFTFPSAGTYKVIAVITVAGSTSGSTRDIRAEQEVVIDTSTEPGTGSSGVGDAIGGTIISLVNIVIGVITGLARWIVWVFTTLISLPLLEESLKIRAADTAGFVLSGWSYMRDIVNMLFIIVLIIIGFGTILRIESYNYKKLLVNLIIMAMLVNFSLVIGRIIIQLADVVQFTFLPPTGFAVRDLYKNLSSVQIDAILSGFRAMSFSSSVAIGGTFALVFQFVFELALAMTFTALAIFMVIRNIALWILLILSPFAYALAILPTTASMAKKWWSTFIKYVMFAPIIAFFLRFTSVIYNDALKIFTKGAGSTYGDLTAAANKDFITFMNDAQAQFGKINPSNADNLGNLGNVMIIASVFIIVLVFLWAGMLVTRQLGIFGADAIVGLAEKGIKAPLALAGKGAGLLAGAGRSYAFEKIFEKTGKDWRPSKIIEGWKQSREINRQAREAKGAAVALDKRSAMGSWGTFFQRYWNPEGLKRVAGGGEKEGRKLLEAAAALKKAAVAKPDSQQLREAANKRGQAERLEREAAASPGLGAVDMRIQAQTLREKAAELERPYEEQKKELLRQARVKEVAGKKLIAPDDYLTQQKIRAAVNEEEKTIHTNNWHELVDLFESAEREGKPYRAAAIAQKLTKTYNENELINKSQYTRNITKEDSADGKAHEKGEFFEYSAPGAENFRKLILEEKFKLGREASMMIMSDISDMAEDSKHFEIMRMYTSEHGKLRPKRADERESEVSAELDKMSTGRVLSEGNRLIGSREKPDRDYDITEKRTTYVEPTLVAYYLKNYPAVKFLLNRGQMNPSQAKAVAEPQNQALVKQAARLLDDVELVEKIQGVGENIQGFRNTRRQQYLEIMNQLIHYGATKGPGSSGKSRIEEVRELFAGA